MKMLKISLALVLPSVLVVALYSLTATGQIGEDSQGRSFYQPPAPPLPYSPPADKPEPEPTWACQVACPPSGRYQTNPIGIPRYTTEDVGRYQVSGKWVIDTITGQLFESRRLYELQVRGTHPWHSLGRSLKDAHDERTQADEQTTDGEGA